MSIPQHRADLVRQAVERFAELERALDGLDGVALPGRDEPMTDAAAPEPRDRDAVDVVNHLHAWHVLLLGWLAADAVGEAPSYPADGYTWRDLDRLNRDLRDRYRGDADPTAARERLRASHLSALARLDAMTDAEIFTDGREWLRGASLAEPAHECLGGHYAWALGAIAGPAAPTPA
ncbi:ClbS/DfsB family four-helix bundle protein [Agromyces binzhouensis]|uniref:ClbS/DfsB family four-helix bundle protein n=1 Tax=Agromyces binzhouensis TaxID=1817495 RepID=UPI00362B5DB0